jgi:hypothetical protein
MNIEQLIRRGAVRPPLSIVINCRPDRVERNGQMGAIVSKLPTCTVYLIGQPTKSAQDGIADGWPGRVVDLGGTRSPEEILETLIAQSRPDTSLVAIGNIHGQGELLLEQLARLPVAQRPMPPSGRHPRRRIARRSPRAGHPARTSVAAAPGS